ncbi:tripartite motif-containing protein 16 [Alosa pseudoharengus]|uniref:tripartite motif-containing protein 16 n=1 Tax=Alosa pseudoharengus TaxID=34774 RepID=UPI003F8C7841
MTMPSNNGNMNGLMAEPKRLGIRGSKGAVPVEKPPAYEPNIPEPKTRADLLKYWVPVSLDERTAQKMLWISEGGQKVSRMADEMCPYLDRPERYEHSPQVLCKEGIQGWRGYWEVEYDGWVVVGAALESSGRKAKDGPCGLGENEASWGAGWAGSCYHVWHNGDNVVIQGNFSNTMGIYVDQPAGIIMFFLVEPSAEAEGHKEVQLLHKFKSTFSEKVFPGFWVGRQSYCWISKKD